MQLLHTGNETQVRVQQPQAQVIFTGCISLTYGLFHVMIIRLCGSLTWGWQRLWENEYLPPSGHEVLSLLPCSFILLFLGLFKAPYLLLCFLLDSWLHFLSSPSKSHCHHFSHSLTRTFYSLTLLSSCHAILKNLSLCHSISLLPGPS